MLTRRALVVAVAMVACRHDRDPGFDIVRVPLSAYASPDAGAGDAASLGGDGGPEPFVVCVKPEKSDDDDDCPPEYHGRRYDAHVTERHHNKGESDVCCYRQGRR